MNQPGRTKDVLVVFYRHNDPVSVGYFMRLYCFFLYQLTFTMLMHTVHF